MSARRFDTPSLVGGLLIAALGTLLLLDQIDAIALRFGALWPALTGTAGAFLLAAGLARGRQGERRP